MAYEKVPFPNGRQYNVIVFAGNLAGQDYIMQVGTKSDADPAKVKEAVNGTLSGAPEGASVQDMIDAVKGALVEAPLIFIKVKSGDVMYNFYASRHYRFCAF